jgi:hypothetical protein
MDKELKLDFSGGSQSWFDFWHTHVDWDGKGNTNWKTREKYLIKLLAIFQDLKIKLNDFPNDFQLWILLDEKDSEEDSVYIHSKNPNADNFPLKVKADKINSIKDKELKEFVDSLNLELVRFETSDGYIYYLFDRETGISLTE